MRFGASVMSTTAKCVKNKNMNREIKFRGKSLDGIWEYGDLHFRFCNHPHIHNMNGAKIYIDPDTVGQYTGLHDKNGKEIYEGDIVYFNQKFVKGTYYVSNDDSHCGAFLLYKKNNPPALFGEVFMEPFYCEVIGNIHDNPELLKGGRDE